MEAEEKEVGEGEAADQDKGTPQEGDGSQLRLGLGKQRFKNREQREGFQRWFDKRGGGTYGEWKQSDVTPGNPYSCHHPEGLPCEPLSPGFLIFTLSGPQAPPTPAMTKVWAPWNPQRSEHSLMPESKSTHLLSPLLLQAAVGGHCSLAVPHPCVALLSRPT